MSAGAVPVGRLTVLHDAGCSLCAFVRDWLVRQPQLVPLDLVPAGSEQAGRRFPQLGSTLDEITVVGDGGGRSTGPQPPGRWRCGRCGSTGRSPTG